MNHEQIAAKLEEKNIRPSVQRMAIYNFLAENPVHPTVDTIYTALSPQMPTLSRTTVYNTLRQFSECGLVQTQWADLRSGSQYPFHDNASSAVRILPFRVPHAVHNKKLVGEGNQPVGIKNLSQNPVLGTVLFCEHFFLKEV